MIPPIWIVELARIGQANSKRRENSTETDPLESLFYLGDSIGIGDDLIGAVIFQEKRNFSILMILLLFLRLVTYLLIFTRRSVF
jgi:hypothetical protein